MRNEKITGFDSVPEFKSKKEETEWRSKMIREILADVRTLKGKQVPLFLDGFYFLTNSQGMKMDNSRTALIANIT